MEAEQRLAALELRAHVADMNVRALFALSTIALRLVAEDRPEVLQLEIRKYRKFAEIKRLAGDDPAIFDLVLVALEAALQAQSLPAGLPGLQLVHAADRAND